MLFRSDTKYKVGDYLNIAQEWLQAYFKGEITVEDCVSKILYGVTSEEAET